jgi:poly(3-hydroxybutyrate) depolymerase
MHRILLSAAVLIWAATAQVYAPGPQVLTYLSDVDDTDQPYAIYVPKQYSAARKYPLVISLHGPQSNHRLNLRRVFGRGNRIGETDAEASRYWPVMRDLDMFVASPLARGTMGYKGIAEKDVYDVLADVKRRFSIDEDRVYLTGLSMGGGGALWLGLTRPDVWAAIAAVAPAVPHGAEPLAGNALNLPVRIYQGELDPIVPAKETRQFQQRLEGAGVKSEYVEYKGLRHNAWDVAYKDAAALDWMATHRRVGYPDRVRFSATSYKHGWAYWVRFDVFTPGELASIDARFAAKGRLAIETKALDGFTLNIKRHPMAGGPLVVTVDGVEMKTRSSDSLHFARAAKGGWRLAPSAVQTIKRRGAEGPIADALSDRHIYVYGTRAASDDDEVQRRRAVAQQAADWSTPRLRLMLTFRVLADHEVSASDLQNANLVLFGTKETNSLIAKYADRLPMSLNAGAADYGMVYVYPVDGRYVVVQSGLPWWTRFDQAALEYQLPYLNTPQHALMTFGDYFVFRGGLENIATAGRFDRDWKLPADAARRLRALGAIEVR